MPMTKSKTLVSSDSQTTQDNHNMIFEDATAFSMYIERRSIDENTPCMLLILDFCERRSLDVDDVTDLITKPLKEKIRKEMIDAGYMRKTESTLDELDG